MVKKMRRILVIPPIFLTEEEIARRKKDLENYAWYGTEVDVAGLQESVAVNSRSEADVATPEFLDLVINAEKDGYDAVISDCYCDVGVDAASELVKIPVLGPLKTSAVVANMLGQRFSIITIGTARAIMLPRLRDLGLDRNYVSTRGIDFKKFFISFAADSKRVEITKNALMEEGKKALADGAHVIILGCTGFPLAKNVKEELKVPIIDGVITLKVAEALTDLNLGHGMLHTSREADSSCEKLSRMRIKLLVPTSTNIELQNMERLKRTVNKGTEISSLMFEDGPASIKSVNDIAKVSPFIIKEAASAEKEGFDAVVISSFEDPGLEPAREVCDIPVVGSGEASMLLATLLGKFSIITYDKGKHHLIERMIRKIGIEKQLLSIRSVNKETKVEKLLEEVNKAITEGDETIIMDKPDARELIQLIQPGVNVPVLDSLFIALKMAEVLHSLNLSHSKLSYPKPVLPAHHKMRLEGLKKSIPKSCSFLYSGEY